MAKREEFYKNLKEKLVETTKFPTDYLYKFIVPTDKNQVKEVETLFDGVGAVINTKKSKTGKYISVSIRLKIASADKVIHYYQQAEKINGIISL